MSVLKSVLAFLRGLWVKEPLRVLSVVASVIVFVAGLVHVVLPTADVYEVLLYVVPILLGGEVARSQVTPS